MDKVLSLKKDGKDAAEAWLGPLTQFNTNEELSYTFAPKFGVKTKRDFMACVCDALRERAWTNKETTHQALVSLRLCAREKEGCDCLREQKNANLFASLAKLDCGPEQWAAGRDEDLENKIRAEATKVMVNSYVVYKDEAAALYHGMDLAPKIITLLRGTIPEDGKDAAVAMTDLESFVFCRLLSHVGNDTEVRKDLMKTDCITVLAKLIAIHIDLVGPSQPLVALFVRELLKVLFVITLDVGPLSDPPAEEPKVTEVTEGEEELEGKGEEKGKGEGEGEAKVDGDLVPAAAARSVVLKKVPEALAAQFLLLAPPIERLLRSEHVPPDVKSSAVNALINLPTSVIKAFNEIETLTSLMDFLEHQCRHATEDNMAEYLTPILLVLTSVANVRSDGRKLMKARVFEGQQPPPVGSEGGKGVEPPTCIAEGNTIGSILVRQMTTSHTALKHYVQEYLFALCEFSTDELIRYCGFGYSAGLLATLNLGMFAGAAAQSSTTRESLSQFMPPKPSGDGDDDGDELTDEDKDEEKARQLGEWMQRLEEKGLIKVVRKGDKEDGQE
eukprot:TRINITY_DN965_c3_g2_i1.p1 TRINITY_DN965_c3_g2~~TRINITY_DN965_c3_g2_i1.p1  ORF type:complete len:573 (+),score=163.14 TRINITY_DN965_c3_g2_i1:46-1719(+)